MQKQSVVSSRLITISLGVLGLFGLYLTSLDNYLLFHGLAELFSIVVAFAIFIIFWNARRFADNSYFLFLAIAYLFVGVMDLIHTMAYPGMPIIQGSDTNMAAQLWIASRYIHSSSLLAASLLVGRKLRANLVLLAYAVTVSLLLGAILYWDIFPACFVEGVGLTPFKIISEYIVSLIFLASMGALYLKRREFDANVFRLLVASAIAAVASELAITSYAHPYAIANPIGHVLKIVSFYLTYRAVVQTGLMKPFDLLFRDLKREQEALQDSEERYRTLFAALPLGVGLAGPDGQILAANAAMCQMTGYSQSDLLGVRLSDTYRDPQDRAELIQQLERDGSVQDFKVELSRKDGTAYVASLNVTSSTLGGREVLVTVAQDITRRRRMEELLRESEEKYRDLVENIEDIIYAIDAKGIITYVSPAIESQLGYTPSEVMGRSWAEVVAQEDLQLAREGLRRVLSGDIGQANEYRVLTKSGETLWMRTSGRPILADDRIVGVRGVISDISERKGIEEALRESEERYRTVVEDMPALICRFLPEGVLTFANEHYCRYFDKSRGELEGRSFFNLIPEEEREEVRQRYTSLTPETPISTYEHRVLDAQGALRWQRWTDRALFDQLGRPVEYQSIGEDITESKQAQEALLEAKEAAEAARRADEERRLEAERRREIAESLADVVTVLNSNLSLDEVLDYIVVQAGDLLGNQAAGIYRLEDGKLTMQAARGLLIAYAAGRDMPVGQVALRQAVELRQTVAVPDLGARLSSDEEVGLDVHIKPLARTWADLYQALLAVPIIVRDGVYGGIALYYSEPREFPDEEVELAAVFGDQIALAIENARLKEQVREAAAIAERERLARDLHDAVTQTLFSASLIAEALPRVWGRRPDAAQQGLAELRQLTQGALAEMRTLLLELRPAALTEKPLGEILGHLARAVTSRTRVPIALKAEGDSLLPADAQIALYRIAQEALNNMAKHSRASEASVSLLCETERVTLRIHDDGRGFDPSDTLPDQLGLGIMQERAESIGASLTIESQPNGGTEVVVKWPATNGRQSDD